MYVYMHIHVSLAILKIWKLKYVMEILSLLKLWYWDLSDFYSLKTEIQAFSEFYAGGQEFSD